MSYGYGFGGFPPFGGFGGGFPFPGLPGNMMGNMGAGNAPQWGANQAPGGGYGGNDDPVRTLFITGFPSDVKERELNNMLRYMSGYIASQMTWKDGQAHGFAMFNTPQAAVAAISGIQGVQFDEGATLRCEMARKNMFTREEALRHTGGAAGGGGGGGGGMGSKRARYDGPRGGGSNTYSIVTAEAAGNVAPVQPVAYQPVANQGDNPPCSTLFVGNLADAVREEELTGLFGVQPGFKQLKVVRGKAITAFVEYADVNSAMAVHQQLQGAVLPSSDRGGIRIQYSKNPFGKRKDAPM